jgi:hypothetical protein
MSLINGTVRSVARRHGGGGNRSILEILATAYRVDSERYNMS